MHINLFFVYKTDFLQKINIVYTFKSKEWNWKKAVIHSFPILVHIIYFEILQNDGKR